MNYILIQSNTLLHREIQDLFEINELNDIIRNNKNKKIGFYIIFGEGEYSYQTSEGDVIKTFVNSDSVKRTYEKIKFNRNLKVFDRHLENYEIILNQDNRIAAGEIYRFYLKKINNKLYIIAVAIFEKNFNLDLYPNASLEGELFYSGDNQTIDYINILSFAIFNEENGFKQLYSDAGLINYITSYKKKEIDMTESNKINITLEDVKEYIRRNNIKPSQIFDSNSIIGFIKIGESIEFEGGDTAITSILEKKLKDKIINDKNEFTNLLNIKTEYEKIKEDYFNLKRSEIRTKLKNMINEKAKDYNLDDKAIKFLTSDKIINDYNKLEINNEDINSFLKEKLEIFKEITNLISEQDNKEKSEENSEVNKKKNLFMY